LRFSRCCRHSRHPDSLSFNYLSECWLEAGIWWPVGPLSAKFYLPWTKPLVAPLVGTYSLSKLSALLAFRWGTACKH